MRPLRVPLPEVSESTAASWQVMPLGPYISGLPRTEGLVLKLDRSEGSVVVFIPKGLRGTGVWSAIILLLVINVLARAPL